MTSERNTPAARHAPSCKRFGGTESNTCIIETIRKCSLGGVQDSFVGKATCATEVCLGKISQYDKIDVVSRGTTDLSGGHVCGAQIQMDKYRSRPRKGWYKDGNHME